MDADPGYPRQESREIVVRYKGSVIVVKVNGNENLLVCPVCNRYYFTSEKDLALHIISHAKQEVYKYTNSHRRGPESGSG